jgi:flagellar biogenesis protein FliO
MTPLATYLVETFVTLVAVVAIAILVLVGARRLGVGRPHGPMRLVGRMPLDARRAIYLVQVGGQVLILGASEAGLTKLGELRESELGDLLAEETKPTFSELLAKWRGKPSTVSRQGAIESNQRDENG